MQFLTQFNLDYIHCELCCIVLTYGDSSISTWTAHTRSMKHKAEEEAKNAAVQQIVPTDEILQFDRIMITPSREEINAFAEVLAEYFVGAGKLSPYSFDCDWFQDGLRLALQKINISVPKNFLPKRKCVMRMITQKADQHRYQTMHDIEMALLRNPNTRFV